jgi:hypothetical protein
MLKQSLIDRLPIGLGILEFQQNLIRYLTIMTYIKSKPTIGT